MATTGKFIKGPHVGLHLQVIMIHTMIHTQFWLWNGKSQVFGTCNLKVPAAVGDPPRPASPAAAAAHGGGPCMTMADCQWHH